MFVTLTLPSYGRVIPGRGVPVDPARYDYRRAALDALHFPKVVDRWVQNLRRCAGYKVQYFAAVEPQKRLAPHLHAAIRGAIPRATVKAVTRATYVNVWWPAHRHRGLHRPRPAAVLGQADPRYTCPDTGQPLTTWEQALDDLDADLAADPAMPPAHVVRLGSQLDVKGLLGGTDDSDRAVRYLCKYLTKSVADDLRRPRRRPDRRRTRRTSTGCTPKSWCCRARRRARTGCGTASSPRTPAPAWPPAGARPRRTTASASAWAAAGCWSRAAWTGKTLTEHRADRAEVVRQVLEAAGIDPPEARRKAADVLHTDGQPRYVWEDVPPAERDYAAVIVASIAEQRRWRAEHEHAKALAAQRGSPPTRACGQPFGNSKGRQAA